MTKFCPSDLCFFDMVPCAIGKVGNLGSPSMGVTDLDDEAFGPFERTRFCPRLELRHFHIQNTG